MLHGKSLHLEPNAPEEAVVAVFKALASQPRWRILQLLSGGGLSVNEIAHSLRMPTTTVAAQVKTLEQANLLRTELRAASHGLQKICTRTYDNLLVQLPEVALTSSNFSEVSMPIGAYTHFEVLPTCGLASPASLIGYLDDPLSFYEPERVHAGLIWFRTGWVEYTFPNRLPASSTSTCVTLSMEICSEAPLHNPEWPSDITLQINSCEVGTWTCPGDFGGQRGSLTPQWWDSKDSQYGVLKRWLVNSEGSFVDGHRLSTVTLDDLHIDKQPVIEVRIGVKSDAHHPGGINLFGHTFGNYAQDLTLRIDHSRQLPGDKQ